MSKWMLGLNFVSALGSGLIAGIFFAFSAFVMVSLARIPSEKGITAMQSINATILNTLFSFVFMGTALFSVLLGIGSFLKLGAPGMFYVLAGSLLYFVGSFLVTIVFNVPLNDALADVNPESSEGAKVWQDYLSRWTAWNHVRTIASLASMACFILAMSQ